MIDWLTFLVPLVHHPVEDKRLQVVSVKTGEIDWATPKRRPIEGSHSAVIAVRSRGGDGGGQATHLEVSGNPSKFLQGHNVFGSEDALALSVDTVTRVLDALELSPTEEEWAQIRAGEMRLINVDITYSFELPSRADVKAWLRAAEYKSKSRHGRPINTSGTIYFGKGGTRHKFKFYSKGDELDSKKRGHQLPEELLSTPIKSFADNLLRGELTLLSRELKDIGIQTIKELNRNVQRDLFGRYIRRIDMNAQISLSSDELMTLPTKLQSTYLHWNNGVDLRQILPKATFYRHRRELLAYDIDIALTKEKADRTNVVPLIKVLEATPVDVPEWAFQLGLVHPSAA